MSSVFVPSASGPFTPKSSHSSGSSVTAGTSFDSWFAAGTSNGVTVTANAAANTKGTWTELLSASTAAATGLHLSVVNTTTASKDYLIDIGTGTAGNEVAVISNLLVSAYTAAFVGLGFDLPLAIASGARISARCQCTTGGATVQLGGQLYGGGGPGAIGAVTCQTLGAATADSGGTSVDPGGSINTKGSWTQLTAATAGAISELVVAIGAQANSVRTNANHLIDIGTGAGGAEVVLIPNICVVQDSANDVLMPAVAGVFPVTIPAATRVAVRQQSSINDATDRLVDIVAYGFGA